MTTPSLNQSTATGVKAQSASSNLSSCYFLTPQFYHWKSLTRWSGTQRAYTKGRAIYKNDKWLFFYIRKKNCLFFLALVDSRWLKLIRKVTAESSANPEVRAVCWLSDNLVPQWCAATSTLRGSTGWSIDPLHNNLHEPLLKKLTRYTESSCKGKWTSSFITFSK